MGPCHVQPNFGNSGSDIDSDSDCGYTITGGVNHKCVESDDNSDWSDGSESDSNFDSESSSLSELEGSELEENLQKLQMDGTLLVWT